MAEWSAGDTVGLDRVLYRDGRAVGMVDSPEIAAEIVEALNTIDSARRVWERIDDGRVREWTNVGDPPPESGRERSLDEPGSLADLEDIDDHPVNCGCAVCLQERDELFS